MVLNQGIRSVVLKGPKSATAVHTCSKGRALEVDLTAQHHGAEEVVVAGLGAAREAAARTGEAAGATGPRKRS